MLVNGNSQLILQEKSLVTLAAPMQCLKQEHADARVLVQVACCMPRYQRVPDLTSSRWGCILTLHLK